jgi:hypothetical protein
MIYAYIRDQFVITVGEIAMAKKKGTHIYEAGSKLGSRNFDGSSYFL